MNSLLVMPDGDLVLSGVMRFPGEDTDKRLVRVNSDGNRDEGFYNSGLGGVKLTNWTSNRFYVGTSSTVRRIWMDGQQDDSFIEMNADPYFSSTQGGDYHVYPDGRILMSGRHLLSDVTRGFVGNYNFIWFSNEGYLDTTRIHRTGNGIITEFEELPDGKFICSGGCTVYDGHPTSYVHRVFADGTLDTTFYTGVNWGAVLAFHPLSDGRVLAGGLFKIAGSSDTLNLVRFMPDGAVDPTFTAPDFRIEDLTGLGPMIGSITPYGEDRLIISGRFEFVNEIPRQGICAIDTSGALLEELFVGPGCGYFEQQGIVYGGVNRVYLQGDSVCYIVGSYHGYADGVQSDPLQRKVSRLRLVNLPLSVRESEVRPLLRIYPNPASTSVTFKLGLSTGTSQLVVRDVLGREVWRSGAIGLGVQIVWDVRTTLGGTYMVEVYDSVGVLRAVERLVLQP